MKNSIKRAQSRAGSSFAERENFRPKVKQLKKTLLTLVALLALTTHAWAEETLLVTIYASDDFKSGSKTFDNKVTATFSGEVYFMATKGWCGLSTDDKTLTVEPVDGVTITRVKFYTTLGNDEVIKAPFEASMSSSVVNISGNSRDRYHVSVNGSMIGAEDTHNYLQKIEVYGSSATGPEVAWNKKSKTGTFTMPGGNVTLEPEYYPQAALTAAPTAINDVPATTDGAIVKAGTVKNIGETTTAQGTVMYYVSPTALDDAALLALAADQWTADVPTAKSLAQGQAYVYYYVRGNDSNNDAENFSDGDILAANALTVTIAAAPTYAVTFADGVNPEPPAEPEWTASPAADVKKGQTVTVTYTGTKKVIGVKAEKKASTVPVTAITLNKTETSIKVGSTETLSVTAVAPDNATDKTYTWKTSDESKATVDQDGKVTAVAAGTVTIYAEANDGSGVKGNCTVTVTSAVPEYYNKLTKINDNWEDQEFLLKQLGRGRQAYNSSLTAAQAYALATYQAAIDGKPVYVIMSSQEGGYSIHYALSTDAAATEHTAELYDLCNESNPVVRMYYVAQ